MNSIGFIWDSVGQLPPPLHICVLFPPKKSIKQHFGSYRFTICTVTQAAPPKMLFTPKIPLPPQKMRHGCEPAIKCECDMATVVNAFRLSEHTHAMPSSSSAAEAAAVQQ